MVLPHRISKTAGLLISAAALVACQTVGAPAERVVDYRSRHAAYSYLDAWELESSQNQGPLWVEAYARSIRGRDWEREQQCAVAFQVEGEPLPQAALVRYLETLAQRYVDGSQSKGRVQVQVVPGDDPKQNRVAVEFDMAGWQRGLINNVPGTLSILLRHSFDGTVTETGGGFVAVFCVGAEEDKELGREFRKTVNNTFRYLDSGV